MKYSLITAANQSYFPFLDIFINSARQHCKNLDQIYVVDCGLGWFKNRVDAEIIDMNLDDEYAGVHSQGWRKATRAKTLGLLKLLDSRSINQTLLLVDSDVCFVQDPIIAVNVEYDIQATVMSDGGHTRRDGITIREIACFTCFNNLALTKDFVKQWSANIKLLEDHSIDAPHETPAFNFAIKDFRDRAKIGKLDENQVCADLKQFENTLSVHFKSNGGTLLSARENFITRVAAVRQYTKKRIDYYQYQNPSLYKLWLETQEKQ